MGIDAPTSRREAIRRLSALSALASSALLLAGCGRVATRDRADTLGRSVQFYVKAMRWGEYRAALGQMRQLDGEPIELPTWEAEQLDGVDVITVNEEITNVSDDAMTATMRAGYTYHLGSSTRILDARQEGTWWYDEDAETWYLDARLPSFGE